MTLLFYLLLLNFSSSYWSLILPNTSPVLHHNNGNCSSWSLGLTQTEWHIYVCTNIYIQRCLTPIVHFFLLVHTNLCIAKQKIYKKIDNQASPPTKELESKEKPSKTTRTNKRTILHEHTWHKAADIAIWLLLIESLVKMSFDKDLKWTPHSKNTQWPH